MKQCVPSTSTVRDIHHHHYSFAKEIKVYATKINSHLRVVIQLSWLHWECTPWSNKMFGSEIFWEATQVGSSSATKNTTSITRIWYYLKSEANCSHQILFFLYLLKQPRQRSTMCWLVFTLLTTIFQCFDHFYTPISTGKMG